MTPKEFLRNLAERLDTIRGGDRASALKLAATALRTVSDSYDSEVILQVAETFGYVE